MKLVCEHIVDEPCFVTNRVNDAILCSPNTATEPLETNKVYDELQIFKDLEPCYDLMCNDAVNTK